MTVRADAGFFSYDMIGACQIVCVRGWFEIVVRGCFGSGLWKGPF